MASENGMNSYDQRIVSYTLGKEPNNIRRTVSTLEGHPRILVRNLLQVQSKGLEDQGRGGQEQILVSNFQRP